MKSFSKRILFLSQTDISCDPRILKAITVAQKSGFNPVSIGIRETGFSKKIKEDDVANIKSISNINILSRFRLRALDKYLLALKANLIFLYYGLRLKPSIVHCNDTFPLLSSFLIKKFIGSRLIYDAHELESERSGIGSTTKLVTFILEKILWKSIDELIVVSPSIGNWYADNIGALSTNVILNCPTYNYDKSKKSDYLHKKFSIPDKRKIFIYNGNLCEGRGIDIILKCFSKNDCPADVVFLGYGPYESKIKVLANEKGNIHFHPAVPYAKVKEINKGADIGLCLIETVSLSDYFSLPNKLFEYLNSGITVLASNFPDIKEVINTTAGGFTVELNEFEVAAIIKVIAKSKKINQVNVKEIEKYSWKVQEEKLKRIYLEKR